MKNKSLNITLLIVGLVLLVCSLVFLRDEAVKVWSGICLGGGVGLICLALSNLIMINWYKKHPKENKQAEIDYRDERNVVIRNKAKAKCADIIQWVIMALAWVTIFAGLSLWITLVLVGIFILKNILELFLMNKYNNQM